MGLIHRFRLRPSPWGLDHAHNCLTPGMHVDVLHRDLLLALAAMMVQRVEQHGISPGKLVGLAQVLASALEGLLAKSLFPCPVRTSPDPKSCNGFTN
jgi:hypothetical protein